jgi:hypothetical protein
MYHQSQRMDQTELQSPLNEGIQAVKAGDRPRVHDRLLRVLEADTRSEPAWLWLSAALDDTADPLMALEHVFAINRHHPQALAGPNALQQRLAGTAGVERQPAQPGLIDFEPPRMRAEPEQAAADRQTIATAPTVAAANYDMFQSEDDLYQCA